MAFTDKTAAQRAYLMLRQRNVTVDANFIARAVTEVPDALVEFANRAASLPDPLAELARQNFTVTITNGNADLSTYTGASEPMLPEHIVKVNVPGIIHELHRLADESDLDLPWPAEWAYYAVNDNTLRTRNTDGGRDTINADAIVRAGCVLAIGNIPDQLAPLFLEILAGRSQPAQATAP